MLRRMRDTIRHIVIKLRCIYLNKIWGHNIHSTARISFSAFLDKTCPENITINEYTIVTRGCIVMSHDFARSQTLQTVIGKNCLIGVRSIILPGVEIGDEVVVGAGTVVTNDVPSNSLIVGNPAKIIKSIKTVEYGKIVQES